MKPAYQQTIENIKENLQTNLENGLSKKEIHELQKKFGLNVLPDKPKASILKVFFSQFQNPLIYILLIAATIIFFVGDPLDAFIISGVLFFNAIIGATQEGRTRTILDSLKQYLKSDAIVIRNSKKHIIDDVDLVPGDLIILQEGEKIPGDARITENNNLLINESMLTGESRGVEKTTFVIEQKAPVHDQKNMVFKGTYVLSGAGKAVITQTGTNTEIGKLHHTVETIQTDTPLKKSINQLAHWILIFILCMCVVLFAIGFALGKPVTELLIILTALFICVIPEGLPVVFTLSLVSGARRMAKKQVLVKRLQAVEGLGRTEVLIIDKTGTLTRNEMVVTQVYSAADNKIFNVTGQGYKDEGSISINSKIITSYENYPNLIQLGHAATLLNRTEIEYHKKRDTFSIKGDATEAALLVFGKKLGFTKENLQRIYTTKVHMPFSSQRRYQAGIFKTNNSLVIFISGAPEVITKFARQVTEEKKEQLNNLLKQGYRTVALGFKELTNIKQDDIQIQQVPELVEHDIHLLGFIAIEDAIRPEVKTMVQHVRNAGLKVVMATGDHKDTALYVAKKTGIYTEQDNVIDGSEFVKFSDKEIREHLLKTTVFSRVTPEQKLKIVQEWQKLGKKVAMTGDGVNDAPSLVAADIGIAMGSIGTEVAKQASDMILLNDSFATIVDAIKEGRNIFYALRRVILYFFTTNMGEVLVIFFALLLNMPLPILAAQILWLNLITDGFLDVALAMEPQEKDLLGRKINTNVSRLVDLNVFLKMLYMSIPMGIGSLLVFHYYATYNIVHARTMTLVTMAAFQWFNAWNCRSERLSIFQLNPLGNKWLILATGFVLALQIFLLHNSFMQTVFRTVPITLTQWGIVIAVASPIFFVEEIRKYIVRKWYS